MKTKSVLIAVAVLSTAVGCRTDISGNSYSVGAVGSVNRAVDGVVISKRQVLINGTSEAGTAVGGIGGAAAGAAAGGDSAIGVIGGAVGGAVIGVLIGGAAERNATKQTGFEFVVRTETGALLTIVQGQEPRIEEKEKVIVLYGVRARIIPSGR